MISFAWSISFSLLVESAMKFKIKISLVNFWLSSLLSRNIDNSRIAQLAVEIVLNE